MHDVPPNSGCANAVSSRGRCEPGVERREPDGERSDLGSPGHQGDSHNRRNTECERRNHRRRLSEPKWSQDARQDVQQSLRQQQCEGSDDDEHEPGGVQEVRRSYRRSVCASIAPSAGNA